MFSFASFNIYFFVNRTWQLGQERLYCINFHIYIYIYQFFISLYISICIYVYTGSMSSWPKICRLYPLPKNRHLKKGVILSMTVNWIWWWGLCSGFLELIELYRFTADPFWTGVFVPAEIASVDHVVVFVNYYYQVLLVGFYGISTFEGYLTPNPFLFRYWVYMIYKLVDSK